MKNTWKDHAITHRADASFVIIRNGNPYHVPDTEEYAALHAEVAAWAAAHPDMVSREPARVPSLEKVRAKKYTEILFLADVVKSKLSTDFSKIEEGTWPEQEAGARVILGDEARTRNAAARVILLDETAKAAAVALVETLAAIDGATREAFAKRIVNNADTAHDLGLLTLSEQRGYETRLKAAATVEDIQAIEVVYTVLQSAA